MRQRGLVVAALAWLCVAIAPAAAQTTPDSSLDAKARDVAATLRCPVCQNLSIQDSPSLLAQDMKRLVRERLAAGETPDQVRRYFVSRYGEWVLLKPRASGVDLSVWLLPLLALVGGAVLVWSAVRRWVRQGDAARAAPAPVLAPEAGGEEELRARRAAVQASLRELQAEFAAGRLAPSDLAVLKQRDETELTALNAALKQVHKDRPGAGAGGGAPERAESATPLPRAATVRRWPTRLGWGAGLAAFAVVAVLSLKGSLGARPEGGTITGTQFAPPGEGSDGSPLQVTGPLDSLRITQLEARVRRDSTDVPALVELGHLYLMQGQLRKAVVVDTMAIRLQPDAEGTAKAFADVGMILWSMGQPDGGLKSLDKALFLHPDLPEALLYRGIILFAGLRDMRAAAETFERYLEVAPPDANTGRVRAMLDAARQGSATR